MEREKWLAKMDKGEWVKGMESALRLSLFLCCANQAALACGPRILVSVARSGFVTEGQMGFPFATFLSLGSGSRLWCWDWRCVVLVLVATALVPA